MVVTGRAHRAAVEAQLPELADAQRRARERAARLDGRHRPRRRHPRAPRARRHHRLVRGRPRDHGRRACSARAVAEAVAAARRRLHRDDRHHAHRAGHRLRLHRVRRPARGRRAPSASRPSSNFVEKPDLETAEALPRGRRPPLERRHVHRAAPTGCSRSSRARSPSCTPASLELADGLGRPRDPRAGGRPHLADAQEDRHRLLRRRARGGGRPARRHPRALRVGRRRRLRLARQAQLRRAQAASSRSSARTPACSPTRRAASS